MKIFRKRADLSPYLQELRQTGEKIGFVPTMGALHEGHLSLIEASRKKSDITVCSIFVNPTQFNDPRDLKKYPRPVEKDIDMLIKAGCDVLYLPEEADIYPEGQAPGKKYEIGYLETILEGASRAGHFKGVVQVVAILLEITNPNYLFLGQKDYQQFLILSNYVVRKKLKTKAVRCPIVREPNGLAMSSRNVRLPDSLRKEAGIIFETLTLAAKMIQKMRSAEVLKIAINRINSHKGFKVDYFGLMDVETLKPAKSLTAGKRYIFITSVIVGGVRLLDNVMVVKHSK